VKAEEKGKLAGRGCPYGAYPTWSITDFDARLDTVSPHRLFSYPFGARNQTGSSHMSVKLGTIIISGAVLLAYSVTLLPAIAAQPITEREKRDCPNDYKRLCGDYGLGTEALRACMSRNIKKVSHACVGALVDAGEMTKAQADKLRGKATTSKKKSTSKKTTSKKSTSKKVTSKSTKKK